jgi:hypothetical protein
VIDGVGKIHWRLAGQVPVGGLTENQTMPLYTVTTEDGFLSDNQRDILSAELVRLHTAATGVPANFVHTIFLTYPKGRASVAGQIASAASVMGVVRVGRPPEVKSRNHS